MFVASGRVSSANTFAENVRPRVSSPSPARVRLNAKRGFGSRPAWTRSASDSPSSAYDACRPRLFSSATCTASSIDSGLASSSFVRVSTASRSASVLTTTASLPMRSDATDDTASKPPSFENVVQPARKASTAAAAPILGEIDSIVIARPPRASNA